jgi:hypothetical protein
MPRAGSEGMKSKLLISAALLASFAFAPGADAAGGTGGTPFSMQCSANEQLTQIYVRSGRRIDQLGIKCEGPSTVHKWKAGGDGGSLHSVLEPGEDVVEIRGFAGKCGKKTTRVCALRFVVDGGARELSPQYGEFSSGADDFKLKVPAGRELYGFSGRSGKELDAIEVLTRPRNEGAQRRQLNLGPFLQALNVALDNTDLRLHNRGERHGNSWLRENDSFVSLFGVTKRFTLPEVSRRRRRGLYRHFFYANDINSTKADVATSNNAFVLRVNFEESGTEIKGLCRRKKSHGYGKCPGRDEGDGNTPDVNWRLPRVDVTLLPGVAGGQLVFGASAVAVLGDFQMNGVCGDGGECKKLIGDWEAALKSTAEFEIRNMLNQPSIRNAEAAVTRPLLNAAGITQPLKTAGLDGSALVVTY